MNYMYRLMAELKNEITKAQEEVLEMDLRERILRNKIAFLENEVRQIAKELEGIKNGQA